MNKPALSVVMPVYNGEKYLGEAIDTILNQSFKDFEFLIINDGSTDRSMDIINSYTDNRIRVINNEKNRGIPYTRNLALREAKGEFLAWSDCDDISLPERLETQINFLKSNKEYGICGTWLLRFAGEKTYVAKSNTNSKAIKAALLFKPAVWNATAMYRLAKIKEFNLSFNPNLPIAEDYDFYLRSSMLFPLANIPKVLYKYRDSETSIMRSFENQETKSDIIHKIVHEQALSHLGITPSEAEFAIHRLIGSHKLLDNFQDFTACYHWLHTIKLKNNQAQVYDKQALNKVLAEQFFFISKKASQLGLRTLFYYLSRSFMNFGYVGFYKTAKLAVRCLIRYKKF